MLCLTPYSACPAPSKLFLPSLVYINLRPSRGRCGIKTWEGSDSCAVLAIQSYSTRCRILFLVNGKSTQCVSHVRKRVMSERGTLGSCLLHSTASRMVHCKRRGIDGGSVYYTPPRMYSPRRRRCSRPNHVRRIPTNINLKVSKDGMMMGTGMGQSMVKTWDGQDRLNGNR